MENAAKRRWFVRGDVQMCLAHSGAPFFRIATCKMAPALRRCFVHFDAQMCLAPQRRHFSWSRLAKWLRRWGVLYILTHTCASRHSRVPFFIGLLSSYLRTRRFSEATFRTSGTTTHWENTAIRDFTNIFRACTFFLVTLHAGWSWHLYSAFQLCILSEVRLLNFLR